MEKFVNQPLIQDVRNGSNHEAADFDRDSNFNDIEAYMNDQPRMKSPRPAMLQEPPTILAPVPSESPRGIKNTVQPSLEATPEVK